MDWTKSLEKSKCYELGLTTGKEFSGAVFVEENLGILVFRLPDGRNCYVNPNLIGYAIPE